MPSFLRQTTTRWALWMLGASALLLANPWARFGWGEWAAVLGPLLLAVDRRLGWELVLALGIPAVTLLVLVDPSPSTLARLAVVWPVFGVGVALGAAAIGRQAELEAIAGSLGFASEAGEERPLARALERELGRARRHERPFAVLSIDVEAPAVEGAAVGELSRETVQALALGRARRELLALVAAELHVYADVELAGDRLLALVPEVDETAASALVHRLSGRAAEELGVHVRIGVAGFPGDALCAEDLIVAADGARRGARLRSLPEPGSRARDERQPPVAGDASG